MTPQLAIDQTNRLTTAIINARIEAHRDTVRMVFVPSNFGAISAINLTIQDAEAIATDLLNAAREARGDDGE